MRLINTPFWLLVRAYQLTLSHIIGRSCRHHPTCSHYAIWQLEKRPLFPALLATTKRVLSCNPLFDGGIDYPLVGSLPSKIAPKKIPKKVQWWYIPTDNKFLLIKALK